MLITCCPLLILRLSVFEILAYFVSQIFCSIFFFISEHKNVKLFISHGGMSGIYEAIDSGIPVLGIPLFFDQSHNIANIAHWGAGIMLDHKTLTKDIFVNAIKEMITNYDK